MEGWGPVSWDQGTWGHPVWLLSPGWLPQHHPHSMGTGLGGSAMLTLRVTSPGLAPTPYPALATGGAQRSQPVPSVSAKSLGASQGDAPSPCTLVTLSASPWTSESLAWVGRWWVLTGMGAKTVPLVAGAGVGGLGAGECWDPFAQGVQGQGGGKHARQSCLVAGSGVCHEAGPVPHGVPASGDAQRKDGSHPSPRALP